MDRATYDGYLAKFNARDYDAVLDYYADDFELVFVGYRFTTREQVKAFYAYLHAHLDERITIDRYISTDGMVAIEARVRLEGIRRPSDEERRASGYERMGIPPPGVVVEIPQFIHYHLKDGKIAGAYCAVFEPAA